MATGSGISVQDAPALAALDTSTLAPGTRVYVSGLDQFFDFKFSTADLSPRVVSVAGVAGMRWIAVGNPSGAPRRGPLTPTNPAHLALWFDGFDIDGLGNSTLTNLSPVPAWANKGYLGVAASVSQAVGSRPVYVASGIGGLPSVLSIAGKSLVGTVSAVPAQAARHVFVVAEIGAARTGYYYVPRSTPVGAWALFGLGRDSNVVEWNATSAITTIASPPAQGTAVIEYVFDGNIANLMTMFINGVPQIVTNAPGAETATAGTIIASGTGMLLSEVRVYDAVQTWDQTEAIRAELAGKWSQAVSRSPIDIIPLGDSLTLGLDDETSFGGYRGPLFQSNQRLRPHGLLTTGGVPAPNDHHQGTAGISAQTTLDNIASYLATATKLDAVLLHIGTNEPVSDNACATAVVGILQAIFARSPLCKAFVMRIGIFGEAGLLVRAAVVRAAVLAAFPGDARVIWIDPTLLPLNSDYWSGDGVHANHGGYMAGMTVPWAQALLANGMGP